MENNSKNKSENNFTFEKKKQIKMSDEREIADRLLKIASSASNKSTLEEQDFSFIVAATWKCFRRSNVTASPRKGRKRKASLKKSDFNEISTCRFLSNQYRINIFETERIRYGIVYLLN